MGETIMAKRARIEDLNGDSLDMQPIAFQWEGKTWDGEGEEDGTWTYIEASRCEKCGEAVAGTGGEKHSDLDSDSSCDGHVPTCEGPAMSYYYPMAGLDETDAAKLADTCLCVVRVNGETGLALTGGGMDLSWEICEAFMMLGHIPPVHFADLPGMAGRGVNARDRWIVAGCLKSFEVAAARVTSGADRLRSMVRLARKRASEKGGK